MPLRDHFHAPLNTRRHWQAFHNAWATYLAAALNEQLPPGFFAEPNVQFGPEIDVATFDDRGTSTGPRPHVPRWTPPTPTQTIPFVAAADLVEVSIFASEGGPELVGAIELVSPANKDRDEHRTAFVARCESYLRQGIGVLIVDLVTSRRRNLHQQLLEQLGTRVEDETPIYATAYRPVIGATEQRLQIWREDLAVGRPLPTLPLHLRGAGCLRVDLEATYERTCREQRLVG